MNQSLTVVLPVRNAEKALPRNVSDVLEVAGELTNALRLYIVDEGSNDDTFDVAVELATRFPQVRVLRSGAGRGVGPTLRALRREIAGDLVLVHDGTSPIDANQIRHLWKQQQHHSIARSDRTTSVDDLRRASAVHPPMAAAHTRLLGFQRFSGNLPAGSAAPTRRDSRPQADVGAIPPLPRPNFLGAVANFALGE